LIHNQNILVVGGGDSAIESSLLLLEENNNVSISYRSDGFSRLKPKNLERINSAISEGKIKTIFNSNVKEIHDDKVYLIQNGAEISIPNDLVFVFAGGELPTKFLEKIGIAITKKFGDAVMKHKP
jgi:thioredoxin reductase (NADPH)